MLTFICETTNRKALYRCDCGTEVEAFKNNVKRGHTSSCGCFRRSATRRRSIKHGHAAGLEKTRAYTAWRNMRARCGKPGTKDFKNYGGRGITICREWEKFDQFLADMGEPPKRASLDRIDNDSGYSKANCRWAPRKVQNTNRRSVVLYSHNGKSMCVSDWARETGIERVTLLKRLQRGVPFHVAISTRGFLNFKRMHKSHDA